MEDEVVVEEVAPEVEVAPTGDNPAWNDFLSTIPSSMHDMVKPHLQKWDTNVQEKLQSVHSEYADFKPYRDAGISKDALDQALQIFDALNEDPKNVYEILGQTYGFNAPGGVQQNGQGQIDPQAKPQVEEGVAEYDVGAGGQFNPKLAELETMSKTMAQIILQQETERQNAQADVELENELKGLETKHGKFDERFVLSYMGSGMSGEEAVQAFMSMKNEVLSNHNRPQAPTVISGSGSLPSNAVNPSALSAKDTRALVANMFKASNSQGA